jgi:hypothetical protein
VRYSTPRIGAVRSITFAATGAAFQGAVMNRWVSCRACGSSSRVMKRRVSRPGSLRL